MTLLRLGTMGVVMEDMVALEEAMEDMVAMEEAVEDMEVMVDIIDMERGLLML